MYGFHPVADIMFGATEEANWTHTFYVTTLVLSLMGDVLIPILFFRFERMEQGRRRMHQENKEERMREVKMLESQLAHLDDCFDSLRREVVTTSDLEQLAARIFRLEDKAFK